MNPLEHKIPPPIVAVLFAFAMWPLSSLLPKVAASENTRLALSITVALIGIGFALAGVIAFRRSRTTVNPLHPEQATALVTGGVYRVSRNPMYAGILLCLLAWAIYLASPLSLAGPVAFILYINRFQIGPEEKILAGKFGASFSAYCASTRRWL
jgi:protein-S-isoprenylcysteine O-methyltransferase Ste14